MTRVLTAGNLEQIISIAHKWARALPELRTRPYLLAALVETEGLRHVVFNTVNALHAIAAMPDKKVALHIVSGYEPTMWERLNPWYLEEPENPHDRLVAAELRGFIKNLLKTVRERLSGRTVQYGKYDVQRSRWWRENPWEDVSTENTTIDRICGHINAVYEVDPLAAGELVRTVPCSEEVGRHIPIEAVTDPNTLEVIGYRTSIIYIINAALSDEAGKLLAMKRQWGTDRFAGIAAINK